jgi:hypothetical protein
MKKIVSMMKCSPLPCLTLILALVGWVKADVAQIRTEISGIYKIMAAGNGPKMAVEATTSRDLFAALKSPDSR